MERRSGARPARSSDALVSSVSTSAGTPTPRSGQRSCRASITRRSAERDHSRLATLVRALDRCQLDSERVRIRCGRNSARKTGSRRDRQASGRRPSAMGYKQHPPAHGELRGGLIEPSAEKSLEDGSGRRVALDQLDRVLAVRPVVVRLARIRQHATVTRLEAPPPLPSTIRVHLEHRSSAANVDLVRDAVSLPG